VDWEVDNLELAKKTVALAGLSRQMKVFFTLRRVLKTNVPILVVAFDRLHQISQSLIVVPNLFTPDGMNEVG